MLKYNYLKQYLALFESAINSFGNLFIGLILAKYLLISEYAFFGKMWLVYFFIWGWFSAYYLTPLSSKENVNRSKIAENNIIFFENKWLWVFILSIIYFFIFDFQWFFLMLVWVYWGFLFDFRRRKLIVSDKISHITCISIIVFLLKFLTLLLLKNEINIHNVLLIFIIPSFLGYFASIFFDRDKDNISQFNKEDYSDYKSFSRSIFFSNIMSWFGINGFLAMASISLPSNQFAVLRFYQSLFSAMGIVGQTVESYFYPKISSCSRSNRNKAYKIALNGFMSVSLVLIIFIIIFLIFSNSVMSYLGFKYEYLVSNNYILVFSYLISSFFFVGVVFQRAYMRTFGLYKYAAFTSVIPVFILIIFYLFKNENIENYYYSILTLLSMVLIFFSQVFLINRKRVNL